MKKALSAVLALLMILSCMVFPTVAGEATATTENKIVLSNCDSGTGWYSFGPSNRGGAIDTENFTEGTGSYSQTRKGGTINAGYFEFAWSTSTPIDITDMNRLVFDLYLSDTAIAGLNCSVELRSLEVCTSCRPNSALGYCDHNEMSRSPAKLEELFLSAPVVGWNRVEIPMSAFAKSATATVDLEKISFFRIYLPNADNVSLGSSSTDYSVKIDNLHLTDRNYTSDNGFDIVITQSEKNDVWREPSGIAYTAYEGHGKAATKTYSSALGHAGFMWRVCADGPVDVSGMQNFAFWIYVSDADAFKGVNIIIELNSSVADDVDAEEINQVKTLENWKGSAVVDGWNYVCIPMSAFTNAQSKTGEPWNATRFRNIRIYNHTTTLDASNGLTVAFDTLGFTNTPYQAPVVPNDPDAPVVPESVKPTLISISNCDTTANFNKVTTSRVTVDTIDPSQGKASLATTIEGVKTETSTIQYEWMNKTAPVDATLMQQLSFDLYISDPAAFENAKFELELSGNYDGNGSHDDGNEYVKIGTLADLKGDALVAGWNTFSVPISSMKKNGNPDMTQFSWFRLFMRGDEGTDVGLDGQTTVIKMDNVYMTAEPVVYTDKIPMVMSYSDSANRGEISPAWGSGTYMINTGNTYNTNTIDITGMTWLEFDVKIDNAIVNNIDFRLDMTSDPGHDCDNKNRITNTMSLSKWVGGDLPVNEWVHVKLPIGALQTASEGGSASAHDLSKIPNLKKIAFIRFFANKNTSLPGGPFGCEMKNFCLTKELTGGTELVWNAETMSSIAGVKPDKSYSTQYKDGTLPGIALVSGGRLCDIDGDGDNEWVAQERAEAGSQANAGGLPISFSFNNTVRNVAYANLYSIRFDLYCNDEKVLNHKFDFEITASLGSDVSEITKNMKLSSRIVADLGNDWYTIEVPLSVLTSSCNGSPWAAPQAEFTANRFNFFRIFASGGVSWDAGLVMAVDNVYVTRVAADQVVEKFEIPTGAIPFTTNVLDFVDLNADNNYIHGATSRARQTVLSGSTVDATVYNLLCANLYLENYEELLDEKFCFEITSAGVCDKEENSINASVLAGIFTRFDGKPLQNGNNYVYLDVYSSAFNSHAADLTRVNFVRIFNQTAVMGTKNTVAKLTDLHFANDNILNTATANNMKIDGITLNLNDNVTMNVVADIHHSLTDYTMTVTVDGIASEMTGVRVGTTNTVIFSIPDIQETDFGKEYSFTLVGKTSDGKVLSSTVENYSVKKYCVDMLEGIENGTIKVANSAGVSAMLTDLLKLGAAAQKMDGETALVTDGVDLSKASKFTPMAVFANPIGGEQGDCPAEFIVDMDAKCDVFDDEITFSVNFKADSVSGLKLKMSALGQDTIFDTFVDNGDGTYSVDITMRVFDITAIYNFSFVGYRGYSYTFSMGSVLMAARDSALEDAATDEVAQAAVELIEAIGCYANSVYNYYVSQQ